MTVQKLKNKNDILCVIVFGELAIKAHLSYDRRLMLCSEWKILAIHGQWKKGVAFTFSKGPIKDKDLRPLLVSVIKECHKIGLDVIVTLCDQGDMKTDYDLRAAEDITDFILFIDELFDSLNDNTKIALGGANCENDFTIYDVLSPIAGVSSLQHRQPNIPDLVPHCKKSR
ncbi:hypothetical protein BDFB_012786, partial [Asbolus verrucosus]